MYGVRNIRSLIGNMNIGIVRRRGRKGHGPLVQSNIRHNPQRRPLVMSLQYCTVILRCVAALRCVALDSTQCVVMRSTPINYPNKGASHTYGGDRNGSNTLPPCSQILYCVQEYLVSPAWGRTRAFGPSHKQRYCGRNVVASPSLLDVRGRKYTPPAALDGAVLQCPILIRLFLSTST